MNENKRLIKNTGIIAIGNLSTRLVSFLLLPLYTALLSAEEYGHYDYLTVVATFCIPFISLLMDESIFRFLIDCKTEQETKTVISSTVYILAAGMGAFLLIGIPVMLLLRYQFTVYLTLYVLMSASGSVFSALLRGIGRTDQYALYNFITSTIQIVLNVIFIAVLGMGIYGMLLAAVIALPVMQVIFFFKLKFWQQIRIRYVDRRLVIDMIRYSLPLIPNRISWSITNMSSRVVIMNALGSEPAGLYAVSNKFPNLMDTVYGFFYQSWKESSARVLGDDSQEAFYQSVYSYLKRFLYAVTLGMIAFLPFVFQLMINVEFHGAILFVPILLLSTYFMNISGFYGGIFTAYKDTNIMGTTTIVAAVINLILNLIFIPMFGLYAAAISTLIANFVIYFYRQIKVRKYVRFTEPLWERIAAIAVSGVVLFLFYCDKIHFTVLAMAITVVYAVIINFPLIKVCLSLLTRKKGA